MSSQEPNYDELLKSLSPDALVALAQILKAEATQRQNETDELREKARKAAEMAKFKGLDS